MVRAMGTRAHILVNTLVSIVNRMILVNTLSLNGATSAFRRLVSCENQKMEIKRLVNDLQTICEVFT